MSRTLYFGFIPLWLAGLRESSASDSGQVEDFNPPVPLQQCVLFRTLLDSRSGVDVPQDISDLSEELDVNALEQAQKRTL